MATQSESRVTNGVCSLEVRWIFPGRPADAVTRWFGRFPAEARLVEDVYLLDPYLPGLSVKVRGSRALEVKAYGGSPGLFEVAGRARGRLESWQKWSFPHGPPGYGSGDPACWRPVQKKRSISRFSQTGARGPGLGQEPGCAVELTEFRVRGEPWWTLGFEATGPTLALRSELEGAAAAVFTHPLPAGVELGIADSQSYAQWLRLRPSTG
jgi:hypothetical protein